MFKIFEKVHTQMSFDFYPTRVMLKNKKSRRIGLSTASEALVCFMMQIVVDRFVFFQKAEEIYI